MKYLFKKILVLLLAVALFSSCNKQWDDHNALNHAVLGENLDQLVSTTSSLSKFNEYLKKTGYDKLLASSKVFTVWAPSDDALSKLDQSIVDDTAKLKQFIGNHIAYQEYPMDQTMDIKIKMINGKNIPYTYKDKEIANIPIDAAHSDQFCKNGILHFVNTAIFPKDNAWTYFQGITDASVSSQQSFSSINFKVFDVVNSKRIGTDSIGNAIYDSLWVSKNLFLDYVTDVSNEDSTYTLFVLSNDAYTFEFNKMKPYLTDTTSNPLLNLTSFNTMQDVFKDVVVRGKYTQDNLPDSFYSTKGIKILKKNLIITNYYDASNGSVFTVSSFDIPLQDKIPTVVVEGENYSGKYDGATGNGVSVSLLGIRARIWASGGKDLNVTGGTNGHKIPWLTIGYNTPKMYSIKYNIYWRAINDFQSSTFTQKLAINVNSPAQLQDTTYQFAKFKTIPVYDPNTVMQAYSVTETLLGSWTNMEYGFQRLFLVANNANSGSWNDPLVLDYFKLVPIFN